MEQRVSDGLCGQARGGHSWSLWAGQGWALVVSVGRHGVGTHGLRGQAQGGRLWSLWVGPHGLRGQALVVSVGSPGVGAHVILYPQSPTLLS